MSTRAALRATGAIWCVPTLFALGTYVATSDLATSRSNYDVSNLASASMEVILVSPLLAAYVAWRLRRQLPFVLATRPTRPFPLVVLRLGWPLLIGGPLAAAGSLLSATRAVPDDRSETSIVAVVVCTVFAAGSLAVAVTQVVPGVLSVPILGLGVFGWLALPQSGASPLLHYLSSSFGGCCAAETEPDHHMVLASLALTGTVSVASWALLSCARWRRLPRPVAVGTLAAALVIAFGDGAMVATAAGEPLTLTATETRKTAPRYEDTDVRICVWPENSARLAQVASAAHRLNASLAKIDLGAVRRFSESPFTPRALQLGAGPTATFEDTLYSVVAGYVLETDRCPHRPGEADRRATALMAILVGIPDRAVSARLDDDTVSRAGAALRRGPAHTRRWLLARLCTRDGTPRS